MDKCVQVHQDMMIKLVGKEGLKISPREAFYANNYACAGEIQMLNYYYTHETAANLDDMIKPCLYTRLLMLGLSKDEARLYTEKGIELAMSVLQETERDQNGIGTRAVTLFNE